MGRYKNFLAIFIVSVCFWLFSNGDCLAESLGTYYNFDYAALNTQARELNYFYQNTTNNCSYVSNTRAVSDGQSLSIMQASCGGVTIYYDVEEDIESSLFKFYNGAGATMFYVYA